MEEIIYEMDLIPDKISSVSNVDYNSSIILRAIYETLFTVKPDGELIYNGQQYYWNKAKTILTIILDDNKKWSDGSTVEANDYLTKFYKILFFGESHPIYKFLSYIKNWDEVKENKCDISDFGVQIVGKFEIRIELETVVPFFEEILSSVFLSPFKSMNTFNGPYKLSKIDNKIVILERNDFYDYCKSPKINKLIFREEDYRTTISNYLARKVHITGNTQFTHDKLLELRNDELVENSESNLFYVLSYKLEDDVASRVTQIIDEGFYGYNRELPKALKYVGAENSRFNYNTMEKYACRLDVYNQEKIKLLYSAYYPNKIVADSLEEILSSEFEVELVEVSYNDIRLDQLKNYGNYILLDIVYFEFISILPRLIMLMSYVKDIYIEEYIESLEDVAEDANHENIKKCISILKKSNQIFLLFEITSYQFISPEIRGFYIMNGHASFRKLDGRQGDERFGK